MNVCAFNPIVRYDESEEDLFLKLIQQSQNLTLDFDSISVSEPELTRDRYTSVVIAPTTYSPLSSQMRVCYRRIDIGRFFYGIALSFTEPPDITSEWLSNALLERWGVLIEPDRLQLTIYRSVPRHPIHVSVVIDSRSLVWIGQMDVWLMPEGALGDAFATFQTPLSFNIRQKRINAYLYSYQKALIDLPVELYTYLSTLEKLHTLDVQSTEALTLLKEQTGDDWVIQDTPYPFNLYNARVCYAGVFWIPEHENAHCVVLELDRSCTNLYGYLILYCQMPYIQTLLTETQLGGFPLYFTEQALPGFTL